MLPIRKRYMLFLGAVSHIPAFFYSASDTPLTPGQVLNPYATNKNGEAVANAYTKSKLPVACKQGAAQAMMSFIKSPAPEIYHPSGNALFPDDTALSGLFSTFINNLSKSADAKNFTSYFTKIHLLVLHELYVYLTKIYTVFNMTHIDSLLPGKDDKNNPTEGYLQEGIQQGLNQKTLIINHLINVIEAQSNGAIRARFPTLDPLVATYAGNMLMKHDFGVDLNILMDEFLFNNPDVQKDKNVQDKLTQLRSLYFGLLADYLKFFDRYTQTLHQDDTSKGYVGSNKFAQHAKIIADYMTKNFDYTVDPAHKTTIGSDGKPKISADKIAWLRSLKKLNPPIFFYDEQTMRGLKIIPALAKSLPKNVQKVPWPATIVKDAQLNTHIKPVYGPELDIPVAFFNDKKNRLFVNIPTPTKYIYVQELLPQPDWLNSQEGVTKMLQACLGDFSALLDPLFQYENILDPCIQCIISKAAAQAGLPTLQNDVSCKASAAFIKGINDALAKEQSSTTPPPVILPPDNGSQG